MGMEALPTSDRASKNGGTDFASGSLASAPSVTHVRIPVRPQQRVWYALRNNKSSPPVERSVPDYEASVIAAAGADRALLPRVKSASGLAHRGAEVPCGDRISDWKRSLQRTDRSQKRNR
jgi:hypothetical protein